MSDHTPTTETVIECFLDGAAGEFIEDDVRVWLAEVERAAAVRALEEAANERERLYGLPNGVAAWLRARAAEIQEGKSE